MSFLIRSVDEKDVGQLVHLAKQFALLNMPPDETILKAKIKRSVKSFAGELDKADAEYLFVIEDTETKKVVASSLILAKHGTPEVPHNYFKVMKKERFSQDLGVGFIHTILRYCQNVDGPTEIGGLLVDAGYRRRPEKLGKQISLVRFIFMGLCPEKFESQILCELTPPLTKEGRSEFWESLGRRFTGLPYQEADKLSQVNKEFIQTLFPEEDIYLTLLDSKARLVLGRVGESTMPAKHLLESIGFKYLNEVDPFDGGPHYGAALKDVSVVRRGKRLKVSEKDPESLNELGLVGVYREAQFRGLQTAAMIQGQEILLTRASREFLTLKQGDEVFWSPYGDEI
ncbi:MAG: arginine N-succinyltransferase [Bdellovibrionales bacterium]